MNDLIELLPLPSVLLNWPHPTNHVAIRDYARACVAHATAAKDAEIKALKVDVEAWKASHSMLTDTCHHFQQQPTPRKLEGGNFSHEEVYAYTGTLPPERIEQVLTELEKAQHQVAKLEYEIDGMVEQDDYDIMEKQLTREADELQGELRSLELAITGWLRHGFDPVEAGELLGAG